MQVEEVFEKVFGGFNFKKRYNRPNELYNVKSFHKEAMQSSQFMEGRFYNVQLSFKINKKYILTKDDIVISLKKPYKASYLSYELKEEVYVPNNFVILRGISKKYNYLFITNYLNIIGIENLCLNKPETADLTIDDIKNIKLPNISIEKQESVIKLLNLINERSLTYKKIIDNDEIILQYIMNDILGDNNV